MFTSIFHIILYWPHSTNEEIEAQGNENISRLKHHLWTLWHYPDTVLYVFVTQEPGECGETFIYFSHGVSYQIIPHGPGQIDSSSISILAPCLFTISFLLSTHSPQSFLAPCFPLGSHLYLGWAIKDLSSPIHLWRKLWVLQILQNKTVPNKLLSECWLVLKSQSLTLDWFVSGSVVN